MLQAQRQLALLEEELLVRQVLRQQVQLEVE
jgi:hypothetical protein